ncbi:uncharacterized protein LOC132719915 [Ruditapes philippinarum]|uniref:uncharacterized protein LOC132719915 n=1 Tax=Ruditapes philippinarum TaxID=129788 RepID=UPI00295AF594|nr:uncharacterized protein LOC132719915 [Ruditapes philippinarum]
MQRLGKRKNASNHADQVCSPKKQEIIPMCTVDIGRDETSSSEENDSDVADELFKKLRKNRNESGSEENEELDSGDSSDDDTVHKILDDSEEEESDDDDDNDNREGIGCTDKRNDDNKITASAKIKLSKANKNLKEIGDLPGNEKDKNMLDSSEDEGSGDSSTDEEGSSDDQEEYTKINTRDKSTSKLKGTLVMLETGKTKQNEVESSDDSSSDDSSVNDDDAEYNINEVKHVNEKLQTAGKSLTVKGTGMNSDECSDESNDESNKIMKRENNSDSKVVQIGNKQPLDKEVKQAVKDNIKESSSESDSSDSSDDGSDDANKNYEGNKVSENDESEDEFAAVKKELADIPLEDLMKIKDKLGLKTFNKIMHGDKFEEKKQKVFKRENKNRPMEISAKKRIPVIRNAMVPKEKVRRDPRFDDLSGEFQDKHFMKNYAFLDDVKQKEKLLVQKKMKQTKDEEKKKELSKLLNRMNQQEQLEQKKRHRIELEQQWKQKEKQLVKEGKTPYFLKKSDKKKLELAEKFKELQKSGKVDQYMSKKMKKNAQKEKKKLPGRHERFQ